MDTARSDSANATLVSLEAAAAAARSGFACLFSTSDEYETAVISERRAQGRYGTTNRRWPVALFVGCSLMVAGAVLIFN